MAKTTLTEVRIDAKQYEDHDDCLTAAANDYAEAHDLVGWDLAPRWEDNQRDVIVLTVPAEDFDQDGSERDAALESAFADAIGHDNYQRLLDEKWLPFAGTAHLSMSFEDAVARELKSASEFLEDLNVQRA